MRTEAAFTDKERGIRIILSNITKKEKYKMLVLYVGLCFSHTLEQIVLCVLVDVLVLPCYSTAEYAAPVWERSAHAHLQNPELNQACRAITGCLKPTNVENLYLLAGIAPPEIRRSVCPRVERTTQVARQTHSLFGHQQEAV